ncbi:uncharacterized protein LOC119728748 [Patiria miniata]|uniref:Monocarboxylate transporter n=1 Tax=Patiria miniata TaxID=46514 RepID=A0A914A119_PATMI|nr:uncharacterized protein LOC119728748 [Patiria miniata]
MDARCGCSWQVAGEAVNDADAKMAVPPRRLARCLRPGPLAVIASFFIFFLSLGNVSSFVILYVYLQKDFHASAIETGWVGSAAWAVMNFLAPLPSVLYVRFGCQRVILVGFLLSFAGLLASSFANHLWILYITYGLAFGAGSNFILTATINLVTSHYPGDNNIRATSLASAGQPVGLLVISGFLERACYYLGWRNGLRIMSGLTLAIGMVCTALSRQPSPIIAEDEDVDCKPVSAERGAGCSNADPLANGSAARPVQITGLARGLRSKKAYQPIPSQEGDVADNSDQAVHECAIHHSKSFSELDQRESNPHSGSKIEMGLRLTSSSDNLRMNSSVANHRLTETGNPIEDVGAETSFTDAHGARSATTVSDTESDLTELETMPANGNNATTRLKRAESSFWVRYVRLLRLPGHWLFFSGVIASSLGALFNVIHFVSFAETVGIPEPTASVLLLVMSGMEIASRVLVCICGNQAPIGRIIILAVVCVMAAVATYALVVLPTFAVVTIYVIILGFARGMIYAIALGATIDTFGVDRALESYTSLLLSYGIAGALASTIGISKDLTGSFTISLHIIAVLFLVAAILFVSAHVWRKRNPLNGQRKLIESDVNANICDDGGKGVEHQGNGVLPTEQVSTPL